MTVETGIEGKRGERGEWGERGKRREDGATGDDGGFYAVLVPYRSLSARGFMILAVGLTATLFMIGVVFAALGAWPVTAFFGLDVAFVASVFFCEARRAGLRETVSLCGETLIVRKGISRRHPLRLARLLRGAPCLTLSPYWLRVEEPSALRAAAPVFLSEPGRRVGVGAFLTFEEKHAFAEALREALARRNMGLGV